MSKPPAMDESSFDSFPLDDRLRKALAHLGWKSPTLVQAKALPLALRGKDVLARARTGSGKTGAYALPIVQKLLADEILDTSRTAMKRNGPRAVVLVPTRELVEQVRQVCVSLTHFAPSLTTASLTADQSVSSQKAVLLQLPHIIVATPARLAQHLSLSNVRLRESMSMLVIDEADLLLSYGYEEDMSKIVSQLPNIFQAMVMSATLSDEVDKLKSMVMHNPVTLKLEEDDDEKEGQLSQFSLRCSEGDKFLISYVLLKLGILAGKVLFFVNNIDRCYQLKLFFEQFSIRAAVLNAELPQNSRANIIQSFNRGVFSYLIATDEAAGALEDDDDAQGSDAEDLLSGEEEEDDSEEEEEEEEEMQSKKRKDRVAEKRAKIVVIEEEEGAERKGRGKGKSGGRDDDDEEEEEMESKKKKTAGKMVKSKDVKQSKKGNKEESESEDEDMDMESKKKKSAGKMDKSKDVKKGKKGKKEESESEDDDDDDEDEEMESKKKKKTAGKMDKSKDVKKGKKGKKEESESEDDDEDDKDEEMESKKKKKTAGKMDKSKDVKKGKKGKKEESESEDEDEDEEDDDDEERAGRKGRGNKDGKRKDHFEEEDGRLAKQRAALQAAKGGKLSSLKKAVKVFNKGKDSEYGAARGVDFKEVETVVNFDLPSTLRAYTHRAGRTARAGNSGTVLTLVSSREIGGLESLIQRQARKGIAVVQPLPFNLAQIEGFRYRAEDSLKRVSRLAVRRARLQEIQTELLNAETLRHHFEENPQDLQAIKHDKVHLSKVPDYLLPPALRTQLVQNKRNAKRAASGSFNKAGMAAKRKRGDDPLRSFQYAGGGEQETGDGGAMYAADPQDRSVRLKARYERKRQESRRKKNQKKGQGKLGGKAKRGSM